MRRPWSAWILGLALGSACEPASDRSDVAPADEPATVSADAPATASADAPATGPADAPPTVAIDSVRAAQAAATGTAAARQLREALARRLTAAIESGGAASAIEVCATLAPQMTDSIAASLGDGVEVKRTAARVRNPRNAPDALEREALAYFERGLAATGSLPGQYVQRAGDGTYRYYEPLVVMPLCVQCHGPVESIPPAVRAAIGARYPEDRAVGYRDGDFRGLIRVSLPAEPRG